MQSPLAYRCEAAVICQRRTNNCANCQHSPSCFFLRELPQVCDPFFAALEVRTMVVWPWHLAAGTDAKSQQNLQDLESRFYIDGCTIVWTLAYRRRIFKQKKGSATIGLGLNYHSMVLSQPLSRDTVPLTNFIVFSTIRDPKWYGKLKLKLSTPQNKVGPLLINLDKIRHLIISKKWEFQYLLLLLTVL
jgi:hypothetical protein